MENNEIITLEFEKTIAELEEKIKRLKQVEAGEGIDIGAEVTRLQQKSERNLYFLRIVMSIINSAG